MPLFYDNSAGMSEATLSLDGKNWTAIIGTECCECGDKIDWKSKDAEATSAERRDAV